MKIEKRNEKAEIPKMNENPEIGYRQTKKVNAEIGSGMKIPKYSGQLKKGRTPYFKNNLVSENSKTIFQYTGTIIFPINLNCS